MSNLKLGMCERATDRLVLHEKTNYCVNWQPGNVINGEFKPLNIPEKPKHAVGVSVLLIEDDKILLGRRGPDTGAAQGWFSTPGGRLEIEESIEEGAVREFHEETGAILDGSALPGTLNIVGFKKHFRFGSHYIMFYVLATSHVGQIGNPEGLGKCAGWDFVPRRWALGEFAEGIVTEPKDIMERAFDLAANLKLAKENIK